MEQTWRWFGPDDAVKLHEIRQAGASGIVTALHHIPYGVVWSRDEIAERKAMIEADASWVCVGAWWKACRLPNRSSWPTATCPSCSTITASRCATWARSVSPRSATISCRCWIGRARSSPTPLPGGGTALRFNAHEYAAFDCFMLARKGAEAEHTPDVLARARAWFDRASESDKDRLLANIMAGLPGAYDRYDVPGLRAMLDRYADITADGLRENLARFLREVVPTAEEAGVRMCIHPDDPPRPLFGLPRIVSNQHDIDFLLGAVDSDAERADAVHWFAWRRRGK